MKIAEVKPGFYTVPLKTPFKTALRTVNAVESVVVRLTTASGLVGYGEAPPTEAITGETRESILAAIQGHIAPVIVGCDVMRLEATMQALHQSVAGNNSAKAAVDMAIYDLFSQALGQPLWRVLGGARQTLETDVTISVNTADEMVEDGRQAVHEGYRILKVKVGKGGLADAETILRICRAVGSDVLLRIDANQGWTVDEAIGVMRRLEAEDVPLDLLEQPVVARDIEGMARIRKAIKTPLLADESVFSARQMIDVIRREAADYINIKLMKTGGIYNALRLCAIAEVFGVECMMGCMLESKLAVSAGAHLAAAKAIITRADLDGPALVKVDPFEGGPRFDGPIVAMGDVPGIGITKLPIEL